MATSDVSALSKTSSIAVLTSGGDSQGMNCVLYGLARAAKGDTEVYLVRDGYLGLVRGGHSCIQLANANEIEQYLHQGGTCIGSSRCDEFCTVDGRRKAAYNLMELGIDSLVVVGSDGSLTGANQLMHEWPIYAKEVMTSKLKLVSISRLNLVGIVGSIDNDFYGTDMTVGADSALARIVESIDIIKTTAKSHHRVMIIEVMGRNCGYLTLSAGLATEATYVFLPESPHSSPQEWQTKLKSRIDFERENQQQFHIILVAEGACYVNGTRIRPETIREFLAKQCSFDARVVILGHLQRGGLVSAFDRLMSIQLGIEAYNLLKVHNRQEEQEAKVLTLSEGRIQAKSLLNCIQEMNRLTSFVSLQDWSSVIRQRGSHFISTWANYRELMSANGSGVIPSFAWAIIQLGPAVPGTNAIVFAIARYGFAQNIKVYRVDGVRGLIEDHFFFITWSDVAGICELSGSVIGSYAKLGSHHISDNNIEQIIANLKQRKIQALCIIGNTDAYKAVKTLVNYRNRYEELQKIKICYIPISIKPELSSFECKLGYDSVQNKICRLLSDLTTSSNGTANQLFLVELYLNVAKNVFYQPSLFATATGATRVYPSHFSSQIDLEQVTRDATQLCQIMIQTQANQVVLVHKTLAEKILNIYKSIFVKNANQIQITVFDLSDHLQNPLSPTPFDRKMGVKMGMFCARNFADNDLKEMAWILPSSLKVIALQQ